MLLLCAWKSFTSPSGFSTRTFVVARYQRGRKAVTAAAVMSTSARMTTISAFRRRRICRKSARDALSLGRAMAMKTTRAPGRALEGIGRVQADAGAAQVARGVVGIDVVVVVG